jgi:hypothetical protein
MIPIDVDALLAKTRREDPCSGVTRVTRVTPSGIPSNHAGQETLTAVTQADPPKGSTGNTLVVGAPDDEAVTLVTQRPLALGNSRIVPQGIATVRVSNAVTQVTQVTLQQEERATPQDSSMLHDRASYSLQGQTSEIPQTAPCMESWRCYCCANSRRWRSRYGVLICGTCHPPADAALVAGWEDA